MAYLLPVASGETIGRLARIAAAAFGDLPLRGCMGLGEDISPYLANLRVTTPYDPVAWTEYLRSGEGPPGGAVTSPDGDVVVFDGSGGPDFTFAHEGSGTAADVEHDPGSPFFGWTNEMKAAVELAQGLPPELSSYVGVMTKDGPVADPAKLARVTALQSDPRVAAAIADLRAGIHPGVNDPATLARAAAAAAADAARQRAYNDAMNAWFAAGNRTPFPGLPSGGGAITNTMAQTFATAPTTPAPNNLATVYPTPARVPAIVPDDSVPAPLEEPAPFPAGSRIVGFLTSPAGLAATVGAIALGAASLKRRRRRRRGAR